jgi:hypothetical protein
MKRGLLLFILPLLLLCTGATFPPNALKHGPVLKQLAVEMWPDLHDRSVLGGQIEQETCPSLTSSKCWSTKAELRTSREYGFGLGQITIAYDSEGRERFNNFKEISKLDKKLYLEWKWENRYDAYYQLRALVAYDKSIYYKIKWDCASEQDRVAFMLSAYNGGLGGVMQDRKICSTKEDCDPSRWFGHVANHSWKSKTSVKGYSVSFYQINRDYVNNILNKRKFKYATLLN